MAGLGARIFGEWAPVLKTLKDAPRDFKEAKHRALLGEAEFFKKALVLGIRDQAPGGRAFKPLSPTTIAMRQFLGFKGTKALIERGDLWRGITVFDLTEEVFVGVLRTAKNQDGKSLADIAQLNEEGSKPIVIHMTPKMAALLHAAFRASGYGNRMGPPAPSTGIIVVQVPARPVFGPVFATLGQADIASKRFAERFIKEMKGKGVWQAASDMA